MYPLIEEYIPSCLSARAENAVRADKQDGMYSYITPMLACWSFMSCHLV